MIEPNLQRLSHGIDRLDRCRYCLDSVINLLSGSSCGNQVDAEKLCHLLQLVDDELVAAIDSIR